MDIRQQAIQEFEENCARRFCRGEKHDGEFTAIAYWKADQLKSAHVGDICDAIQQNPHVADYPLMFAIEKGCFDHLVEYAYQQAIDYLIYKIETKDKYPEFF